MNQPTDGSLSQLIERELSDNVFLCYQCVKCASGCPLADHFDLTPNQVMRAVQLNDESVLEANTIWLCASCQTCTTRCPQGLDVAGVMDALSIEARRRDIAPAVPEVARFNRLFLQDIGLFGRLYEVGLMAGRNLTGGQPTRDLALGIEMLKRGKLKLLPSVARRPKRVQPESPAASKIAYYPERAGGVPRRGAGAGRATGLDLLRLQPGSPQRPHAGGGAAAGQPGPY